MSSGSHLFLRSSDAVFPRDSCISCPDTTPVCNCSSDQDCVLQSRTCNTCASIACVAKVSSGSKGGSSVNPGVIAGPVVAVLVIASVLVYLWFRRRRNRDMRQVDAIRRATLKAEHAGFHLGSALNAGVPPADRGARSPSLNNRERAADGTSERFPREAVRASFDALTFGSGQAGWSHLQRSPHGTLGQPGEGQDEGGMGALGMTRTYSGTSINVDPAHPSNRDRLLTGRTGENTSPTASLRQELERDRDGLNPFSDRQSIATDALSFGSTNVIPIAFVPPTNADGEHHVQQTRKDNSALALDAARRELEAMRGGQVIGPPTRPRRSPDLDLRLNAAAGGPPPSISGRYITSTDADRLETLGGNRSGVDGLDSARQSFQTTRTTNSIAPSFFSSQTDLAMDVPMILTSRQVQVGKREVPQVVQLNGAGDPSSQYLSIDTATTDIQPGRKSAASPLTRSSHSTRSFTSTGSDPFDDVKSQQPVPTAAGHIDQLQHARSQNTFGEFNDEQEGVDRSAAPQSRDLRFSMGSFATRAERESFSTIGSQGTGRYTGRDVVVGEARRVVVGQHPVVTAGMLPPRPAFSNQTGSRESMMSGRSDADSLLGSFPIIPPSPDGQETAFPANQLPTSMSSRSVTAPPNQAAKAPGAGPDPPQAGASAAAGDAGAREEALTDEVKDRAGRHTMGLSVASAGLSAFDFRFGDEDEDAPPVPSLAARLGEDRGAQ